MRLDPFHSDPFFMPGSTLCSVKNELEGSSSSGLPRPIRSLQEILQGMPSPSATASEPSPVDNKMAKVVYKASGIGMVLYVLLRVCGIQNSTLETMGALSLLVFLGTTRAAFSDSAKLPPPASRRPITHIEFKELKQKWEEAEACAIQLHQEYGMLSVFHDPGMYAVWLQKRERLDVLLKSLLPTWLSLWPDEVFVPYICREEVSAEEAESYTLARVTPVLQEGLRVVEALKVFSDQLPRQISQENLSLRGRGGVRVSESIHESSTQAPEALEVVARESQEKGKKNNS